MKFAKYLEDNCIPEWKAAYFDYKKGKKLIKQVQVGLTKLDSENARVNRRYDSPSSTPLVSPERARVVSRYGAVADGTLDSEGGSGARDRIITKLGQANEESAINAPHLPSSAVTKSYKNQERSSLAQRFSHWSSRPSKRDSTSDPACSIELQTEHQSQQIFYDFVDAQIRKIDEFYAEREHEASKRLDELRYQLKEMKDRKKMLRERRNPTSDERKARSDYTRSAARIYANVRSFFSYADIDMLDSHPINDDPNAETSTQLLLTYRVARRRLRIAIQEFYHSLELLQSYRSINRTALTKVMKKYDKTARAHSSPMFLQKFNEKTYIGTSEFLDKIMHDSENVYAKYYYNGDRKHAVTALRTKEKTEDNRFTMLRIGLYLGVAAALGLEGLVRSQVNVKDDVQRSFLLQIWGAFFCLILVAMLFGVNCFIWTKNKINYVFIFEYNVRHNLNWMQYLELPSFVALVFSILFWMCFSNFFPNFTIWYPLLFVGITLLILLAPIPFFHFSTRRWFVNAHGRLLISGLATVRFQDVFLGDVYNSLAYSMGNTSLFFCTYRFDWNDPAQCGSSNSRLLGFFTALPGIFRLFQCFRRYNDTRHYFPHLANALKYTMTILQYTCLSLWRIDKSERFKILYIIFATLNSCFTITWDVVMDVSLLQANAKPSLLRTDRAFAYTWAYYVFLFTDPILRFSWIFYIIYENDNQHAAALSFYIALAEVFRRSMWSAFRVENEHVANVSTYRATRELPLPYAVPRPSDVEAQQRISGNRSKTRKEQPKVAEAHATDFERKSLDDLHMDDVNVDSDRSDAEPPSNTNSDQDDGSEEEETV